MYLFGGCKGNSDPNEKMYTLDLKNHKWETVEQQVGEIPHSRDEHSACLYESNSMIIFGGFASQTGMRSNEVYKYTFSTKKWEHLKPNG